MIALNEFSNRAYFANDYTRKLMWLAINYPKASAILYLLIDQMNEYSESICPHKLLEELLNVKKATITRNIKVLKDNGFIIVSKYGTNNLYTVNNADYWKLWGEKQ